MEKSAIHYPRTQPSTNSTLASLNKFSIPRSPFGLIQTMASLASVSAPFALQFLTDRLSDDKTIPPLWGKTEWCRVTSNELRNSLNTVILPLGRVNVGLYHHCSLLFKVLADRTNLQCMLVKGSVYTGLDDGAEHLITMDDGSEYIIELRGAPGTLIPAATPSCLLLDSALGAGSFPGSSGSTDQLSLGPHKVTRAQEVLLDVNEIPKAHRSSLEEAIPVGFQPKHHSNNNKAENSEHKFEKLVPSKIYFNQASPSSHIEGVLLAHLNEGIA
ncbi:hypothetical protein Nepgr_032799 [Nepenthes gracilis]|uniref:EDR1/CTR1/ARMC3-like peptidase-like domain-containing protein n=1 Tax=Nepenthes gracilis TaxID=150966 RepID=A0AAD3TKS6_NEPGR|nr:hypothetical protein Nepgr_032799 [Nepenthes gracilis]